MRQDDGRRTTWKTKRHPQLKPIGSKRIHPGSDNGKPYMQVKVEEVPGNSKAGWKYEHRLVMEKVLGRKLTREEHVHHVNGATLDNRPENLQVISPSEHARLTIKERGYGIIADPTKPHKCPF